MLVCLCIVFFFFNDTATTEIYTLSLHDALPISTTRRPRGGLGLRPDFGHSGRSEEHTSELQSLRHLVCRLLLEKKKKNICDKYIRISQLFCTLVIVEAKLR